MPPAAILSFLYAEPDPINKLMWPAKLVILLTSMALPYGCTQNQIEHKPPLLAKGLWSIPLLIVTNARKERCGS